MIVIEIVDGEGDRRNDNRWNDDGYSDSMSNFFHRYFTILMIVCQISIEIDTLVSCWIMMLYAFMLACSTLWA